MERKYVYSVATGLGALALACSVWAQCPNPTKTQPTPLNSDVAVSDAFTEKPNGGGVLTAGIGCTSGTGWKATAGGVPVIVSNWHIFRGVGDHAVAPAIFPRSPQCLYDKLCTAYAPNCGYCQAYPPPQVAPCPGPCTVVCGPDVDQLGPVSIVVKPGVAPAIGQDDAALVSMNAGAMTSALQNIGPVGVPVTPNSGISVQFNGASSCLNLGMITSVGRLFCYDVSGKMRCIGNGITILPQVGSPIPGDSGSLVVTNDGHDSPVCQLTGAASKLTGTYSGVCIPIQQVISDLELDVATLDRVGDHEKSAAVIESEKAQAVIDRHPELKIKGVATIGHGIENGVQVIYIGVMDEKTRREVERQLPPMIEGYPVLVVLPIEGEAL